MAAINNPTNRHGRVSEPKNSASQTTRAEQSKNIANSIDTTVITRGKTIDRRSFIAHYY